MSAHSVEVIQVIRVEGSRGRGVTEDPVRTVIQYWPKDGGKMLAEVDPSQPLCPACRELRKERS